VRAADLAGRRFSIEMQVSAEQGFEKRMTYCLALLYAGQLREKESFTKLCPAYGIAILEQCDKEERIPPPESTGNSIPHHPHSTGELDIRGQAGLYGASVTGSGNEYRFVHFEVGNVGGGGAGELCSVSDRAV